VDKATFIIQGLFADFLESGVKVWEFRLITDKTRRALGGKAGGEVRYHDQHGRRSAWRVDGPVLEVSAGFVASADPQEAHKKALEGKAFKRLLDQKRRRLLAARPAKGRNDKAVVKEVEAQLAALVLFFAIPIGQRLGAWQPKKKSETIK